MRQRRRGRTFEVETIRAQTFYELAVGRDSEPCSDACRDHTADTVDRGDVRLGRFEQPVHVVERPSDDLAHGGAHMADVESEQQVAERTLLRTLDRADKVLHRHLAEALEVAESADPNR